MQAKSSAAGGGAGGAASLHAAAHIPPSWQPVPLLGDCSTWLWHAQEKSAVEAAPPTEALAQACQHASALARQAGQAQQECGLDILPDEFVRSTLRFGLVEARPPDARFPAGGCQPPAWHGRPGRCRRGAAWALCRTACALRAALVGSSRGAIHKLPTFSWGKHEFCLGLL